MSTTISRTPLSPKTPIAIASAAELDVDVVVIHDGDTSGELHVGTSKSDLETAGAFVPRSDAVRLRLAAGQTLYAVSTAGTRAVSVLATPIAQLQREEIEQMLCAGSEAAQLIATRLARIEDLLGRVAGVRLDAAGNPTPIARRLSVTGRG